MHPLNKVLGLFDLQLSKVHKASVPVPRGHKEEEFRKNYDLVFEQIKNNQRGFEVYKAYRYQVGEHPRKQVEFEYEFVASHLYKEKPLKILDIGSYREFILGLLAHYEVTTVDIRRRKNMVDHEVVVNCDAKSFPFTANSFHAVTTIQALPHIGLGRYGDEIDLDADIKAFHEMIRVLKPGGILLFTTAISGGEPSLAWNARRNYSYDMIREFCSVLDLVEEKFFDRQNLRLCARKELTTDPFLFDYYLGCWRKK